MSEANHPAAEIVAIALRKIRKVANSRKFAKLSEDCKVFLDDIQRIIPPPGQRPDTATAVTPTGTQAASTSNPFLTGNASPQRSAGEADTSNHSTGRGSPRSLPEVPNDSFSTAAAEDSSTGNLSDASSAHAAILDTAGLPALTIRATAGNGLPSSQPASPQASGTSAQAAYEQAGISQGSNAPSQAPRFETAPLSFPDLVPRSETALGDAASLQIVAIMRQAVESQKPEVIEVALDCLQKLIAFRFLQGSVYAISMPATNRDSESGGHGC